MKAKSYEEKRDQAMKEHKAMEKHMGVAPKGAKTYMAKRKENLRKVRGY